MVNRTSSKWLKANDQCFNRCVYGWCVERSCSSPRSSAIYVQGLNFQFHWRDQRGRFSYLKSIQAKGAGKVLSKNTRGEDGRLPRSKGKHVPKRGEIVLLAAHPTISIPDVPMGLPQQPTMNDRRLELAETRVLQFSTQ